MPLRDANGVGLFVEDSGAGDPLVLVHGSWDDRSVFGMLAAELQDRFRVVSYDRRGHTDSEDGDQPGTRRADEDDLAALIEVLDLAPAHVVGNSFGGSIALGLAVRRPELFRTLAVHEPPLLALAADHPGVAEAGGALGPVLEMIDRGEGEAAARFFVENIAIGPGGWDMLPAEKRAAIAANAGTFAEEPRDPDGFAIDVGALARLELPLLVTGGTESPPFFDAINARVADAAPSAERKTLEGAGHVPHETHPAEYAQLIASFIASASA